MSDRDYSFITDKMFYNALQAKCGAEFLSIPGIYEIVSEYFNNEILDELWESEHLDEEDEETET